MANTAIEAAAFLKTAEGLYRKDPAAMLEAAMRACLLAKRARSKTMLADATILIGLAHEGLGDYDKALDSYAAALKLYKGLGFEEHVGVTLHNMGIAYNRSGRFDAGAEALSKALRIQERLGHKHRVIRVLKSLEWVTIELGRLQEGVELAMRRLRIAEEIGDEYHQVNARGIIMGLYQDMKGQALKGGDGDLPFHLAMLLLVEGREDFIEAATRMAIGERYCDMMRFDEALDCLERALAISRKGGVRQEEAIILSLQAKAWLGKGEPATACRICAEAVAIVDELGEYTDSTDEVFTIMGSILHAQGDLAGAIRYLELARTAAEQSGRLRTQPEIYERLSNLFEQSGDIVQAFAHYKRGVEIKNTMENEKANRRIEELQELLQLERIEREKGVAVLNAERLRLQITHKERELGVMAVSLRQRTEMLELVRKKLGEVAASSGGDLGRMVRDMLQELQQRPPQSFETLQSEADRVQEDFNRQLSQRFPKLTAAELRICGLLRGNLSTKEIADLLNVTTRNVETHRYHIRQKIRLPKQTSLTTFLASL